MLSCSADQRTNCCIPSSHRDSDTHVPETEFDGAFGQRGSREWPVGLALYKPGTCGSH